MALLAFAGAEDSLLEVQTTGTVALSATQARSGTNSFRLNGGYTADASDFMTNYVTLSFTASSTVYVQFAVYRAFDFSITQTYSRVMQWLSGATKLGVLSIDTDNDGIKVWSGDLSSVLASTTGGSNLGSWDLWEVKIVIGDSGSITVKKNGIEIITFSGDTKPGSDTTIDRISIGQCCSGAAASYTYIDDIVVCDDQGSYLNTWPGGLRVVRIAPDGAGTYAQWTPSAGANYACVDETPVSDTDYVTSATTGHKDSYTMVDCPAAVNQVKAVVARYWGQGGGDIKRLFRIGGSDYLGAAITVPATLSFVDEFLYVSPATSAAFTPSEITGMESGMEKQ